MERGTTLFLKLAVILIGIPVLAMCIFVVPEIANFIAELYPNDLKSENDLSAGDILEYKSDESTPSIG